MVVTMLVLASFAGVTVAPAAAAAGNTTSATLRMADGGISDDSYPATDTNHNWTVTLDSSVEQDLGTVKLDYSGQDTTFNGLTTSDVSVQVNDSQVGTIESVTTEDAGQTLVITFASGGQPSLTGNEKITVNTTGQKITNPSTAGVYSSAAIRLFDGTQFAARQKGFGISSGTLQGTVTNATNPSQTLAGADVTVRENGRTVATTTTDANGDYAVTVGPGHYTVAITAEHYNQTTYRHVRLDPDATVTKDAALSPTGTVSGTIQDAAGNALTGATVKISNTNSNTVHPLSTGGSNTFSKDVATGTWDVTVSKSGYASQTWSGVTLGENATKAHTFQLAQAGTIQGTVTNDSGSALSGMDVIAWNQSQGQQVDSTRTDANGDYSLGVPAGTYDVFAFDQPPETYEHAAAFRVSVSKGATVTEDLTMSKAPPSGTLTGTVVDPDGNPVSGASIEAVDSTYTNFESTTTDAQGQFSVSVPEGTYEVTASASGYANAVQTEVNVTGNAQTTTRLQLAQAAYVEGTVTNTNGPVQNVVVMADGGDGEPTFTQTDANGEYNLTVAPGQDYQVTVFAQGQTAAPQTASPSAGTSETADFSLQKTEITSSSIEVLNPAGVDTANVGLSAQVQQGMLMVRVRNESSNQQQGMPNELQGLGVDGNTEFRINATVTNYEPTTLLWGARDVTWSTEQNESNPDATDISIRTKAVDLQGLNDPSVTIGPLMQQSPSDVQWPSGRNDRADLGWNRTVYFGVFDMATAPPGVRQNFGGMTVTTNAQTFAPPRVVNDTLKVWVAGPHRTTDGETHSGFYEATIPDSQLQEWGVDPANAASELQVMYQGTSQNFQVTDLDDGVRIHLDIHYSAGTVAVSPSAAATSSSSSSSSGSSDGDDQPQTSVRVGAGDAVATLDSVAANTSVHVPVTGVSAAGVEISETRLTFETSTTSDNAVEVVADTQPPATVSPPTGPRC
ncbi:carboxypeptidase-like regulatory domain-containing protein [Haloarculaceae archaeon H-GB2-1]|nr:carboxypeptidase-like regulatory domain-containing protein [Haloarculaceae archaeon H-GB2-1]